MGGALQKIRFFGFQKLGQKACCSGRVSGAPGPGDEWYSYHIVTLLIDPIIKGQVYGVPPKGVWAPWYFAVFLRIRTQKYPLYRAYIGISHKGCVGRGTSNYPLT